MSMLNELAGRFKRLGELYNMRAFFWRLEQNPELEARYDHAVKICQLAAMDGDRRKMDLMFEKIQAGIRAVLGSR